MHFEWDPKKAAGNLRKHKVRFEEAITVFRDPLAVIFDDEDHSVEERREIIIGHSVGNRLLLVCFNESQKEYVRIFSARELTRRERKDYEERKSS